VFKTDQDIKFFIADYWITLHLWPVLPVEKISGNFLKMYIHVEFQYLETPYLSLYQILHW